MKAEAGGEAEWKGCRQTQKDTRTTAQSKAHFVCAVLPADDIANMVNEPAFKLLKEGMPTICPLPTVSLLTAGQGAGVCFGPEQ